MHQIELCDHVQEPVEAKHWEHNEHRQDLLSGSRTLGT